MKAPIDWLKEFVPIKLTPHALAQKMTMHGLETTLAGEDVLEVDVLPNRGDCHSILGIAREVSAITGMSLKPQATNLKKKANVGQGLARTERSRSVPCRIKDKALCPRYMARVIEGVTIKESPEWIKNRLEKCGVRAINNIVDATNYVLLELGQPLHAFDRAKVSAIVVRRAKAGEVMITLDGIERKLKEGMLVIADQTKPIALAGIMGGQNSEVSDQTTSIVLEAACFDPISISRTSKEVKLRTEASARFEKGVDFEGVVRALDRCAYLMAELSGGKVLPGKIDLKTPRVRKLISFDPAKVEKVLGIKIPQSKIIAILKGLGFGLKGSKVSIPLYRAGDIEREIDLIEEISRIYGYDKVLPTMPAIKLTRVKKDSLERFKDRVRNVLTGSSLWEAQTFTLVSPRDFSRGDDPSLKVANPLTEDESVMRSLLFPSLLKVASHNLRHQIEEVKIFEINPVFLPEERLTLAGALVGPAVDFFLVKGILQNLLGKFELSAGHNYLDGAKSASIILPDGHLAGYFGLLSPEIAKFYDLKKPVYVFELNLEHVFKLEESFAKLVKYQPLPKYPKVDRDISMHVPLGVTCQSILNIIKEAGGDLVEETFLFDRYKDSQAYRVIYRLAQRTLTDEEVNQRHQQVCQALVDRLNVQLRK